MNTNEVEFVPMVADRLWTKVDGTLCYLSTDETPSEEKHSPACEVKDIVETMKDRGVKIDPSLDPRAEEIAEQYIYLLQTTAPPKPDDPKKDLRLQVIDANGTTNARGNPTVAQIRDGYAYILTQLNRLFEVPIQFFESGGPGNWLPQWLYPALDDYNQAKKNKVLFKKEW